MKFLKNTLFLGVTFVILGCATPQRVAVETEINEHKINGNKDKTFDAALVVGQKRNLNVSVLERESGLIRFETSSLSPEQLDQYCEYPYINPYTEEPSDTYQNWNDRSLSAGAGPVRGEVSITILISEANDGSSINIRTNWSVHNNRESHSCNSKSVFEKEFITHLKSEL